VVSDSATAPGLPSELIAPSGWLLVDGKFRLNAEGFAGEEDALSLIGPGAAAESREGPLSPAFGGRVYGCGDAVEKDKAERTAANAHAEGEYVALDILRAVEGKPPLPAFVAPPRLCAISLGRKDGVVVLGAWVALRGRLAAVAKALIQVYCARHPGPDVYLTSTDLAHPRRSHALHARSCHATRSSRPALHFVCSRQFPAAALLADEATARSTAPTRGENLPDRPIGPAATD
jgi:hypothetical protein